MTGSKCCAIWSILNSGTTRAEICLRCILSVVYLLLLSPEQAVAGQEMGKKSKRRGGAGGKKSSVIGGSDQPLPSHEALMQVTAPTSLKGIFSTNVDSTRCVFCNEFVLLDINTFTTITCCGKVRCDSCLDYSQDLHGRERCNACNTLLSKRHVTLQNEARLGKAWAYMCLGVSLHEEEKYEDARDVFVRAAMKGNFDAFLVLSEMYCEGKGVPRDLKISEAYARKARALYTDCGLSSNCCLFGIAELNIDCGDDTAGIALLDDITNEIDENALDINLCTSVAARLWNADKHKSSAEMYVRSFCYGHIESANSASYMFFCGGKFALSKLWLDVACRSKSLYRSIKVVSTDEELTWQDNRPLRDATRSKLREMRNSCGGCGGTLAGESRKYCRCCLTYCYCNEDCQKKHWDGGHREECKEVEEHIHKILKAIRLGKFADRVEKTE